MDMLIEIHWHGSRSKLHSCETSNCQAIWGKASENCKAVGSLSCYSVEAIQCLQDQDDEIRCNQSKSWCICIYTYMNHFRGKTCGKPNNKNEMHGTKKSSPKRSMPGSQISQISQHLWQMWAQDFVQRLLVVDPKRRLSAAEAWALKMSEHVDGSQTLHPSKIAYLFCGICNI